MGPTPPKKTELDVRAVARPAVHSSSNYAENGPPWGPFFLCGRPAGIAPLTVVIRPSFRASSWSQRPRRPSFGALTFTSNFASFRLQLGLDWIRCEVDQVHQHPLPLRGSSSRSTAPSMRGFFIPLGGAVNTLDEIGWLPCQRSVNHIAEQCRINAGSSQPSH